VTIASKRIIFALHRGAGEVRPGEDARAAARRAAADAQDRLRAVRAMFAAIAPELQGADYWRHRQSVSPGLQEYIEALSFAHYLEHEALITHAQVQQTLCADDGSPVRISGRCPPAPGGSLRHSTLR
jgi:predicted translin family RNA/ssDNA-binding protein